MKTMLKWSLCDYSDAYKLVKKTIIAVGQGTDVLAISGDRTKKQIIFKICAPFIACNNEINNTHVDDAKDLDVMVQMNNVIE